MQKTIYLILAAVCCILLCFFSPVYLLPGDGSLYDIHFFSLVQSGNVAAENALMPAGVIDFSSKIVWALPALSIIMAIVCIVDMVLGFTATRLDHLLRQASLNIITLICSMGYYVLLFAYVLTIVLKYDIEWGWWHIGWSVCLPVIIFILTSMAMQAISKSAKKLRRDLSGSIR